jgi:ubiquinone/menaquinone biosynthesis C-methylase UbiE
MATTFAIRKATKALRKTWCFELDGRKRSSPLHVGSASKVKSKQEPWFSVNARTFMDTPKRCLFCESTNHALRFKSSDRWYEVEGTYSIHQCKQCGLLFLCPQPSPEQIAAHYPLEYPAYGGEQPDASRDELIYKALYGPASGILRKARFLPYGLVLRMIKGHTGQRMLDVGCGSGHFMLTARRALGLDVYGVEPNSFDAAFAAKHCLNIFRGTLEQAAFPDQFFDVITLNHVFEHLPEPRSALLELRRILKPTGTLIIGVPQSRCLLWWIFGRNWWQLDVPRHLFVPSSKNLQSVAESAGFGVERVRYYSSPASILATIHYWFNDLTRRKRHFYQYRESRLAFRALLPLAYLLNLLRLGDQIEIVLTSEQHLGH